jgi:alpha-mannosidase
LLNATVSANLIGVTASSQYGGDQAVSHLVDGSGMWRGLHDNDGSAKTMWHSISHPAPLPPAPGLKPSPAWVKFDFTDPQKLASIVIWNHNQDGLTDRGFQKTAVYGTRDGATWFSLISPEVIVVPRASGKPGQAGITVVLSTTATEGAVKSVIIAAEAVDGNFGSDCYGLSAVRFLIDPQIVALKYPRGF